MSYITDLSSARVRIRDLELREQVAAEAFHKMKAELAELQRRYKEACEVADRLIGNLEASTDSLANVRHTVDLLRNENAAIRASKEAAIQSVEYWTGEWKKQTALSDKRLEAMNWAEGLIRQIPAGHNGRDSWLMNHGRGEDVKELRRKHPNSQQGYVWGETRNFTT